MGDFAPELRALGLFAMPVGVLNFALGFALARNPKFHPEIGTIMQWAGISFVPMGAIFYFHPWDDHTTLTVGSTIMAIAGVFIIMRFMRMRRERSENPSL